MKPSGISSWFNSANELFKAGRLIESRKLLIDLQKILPGFNPAIDLLSIIDYKLENYSQCLKWISLLLNKSPENPDLINRQLMVLLKIGNITETLKTLDKGLFIAPDHPGILYCAIKFNARKSNQNSAKVYLDKIPRSHPLYRKGESYLKWYYSNLNILNQTLSAAYKKGAWQRALQIYQNWIAQNESSADSYYNVGLLYMKSSNYIEAIQSFQKCLDFKPHFSIAALLYMWYNKLMICDWSGYEYANQEIMKGISEYLDDPNADYEIPIYILSFFRLDEQIFAKCGSKAYQGINKVKVPVEAKRLNEDKIRIGYLSSSFWAHPVGRVYQDLFALHDRKEFEVFVYSSNHRIDNVSKGIIEGADYFRDLTGLVTQDAYTKIIQDKIDILITVGGHGDDMNMELVAMKPAPVSINAHGYNESLGGKYVDYLISDKEVISDENKACFTEDILFFPRCSIPCSSAPDPIINTPEHYGLPNDKFVFLSAAHPRKITPDIFILWQEILVSAPDSILWIFDFGIQEVKVNLIKSLKYEELKTRILFSGLIPYTEHIGRYHLADLLLDTPIYNCHSVGMEALQSGLPFLTLRGQNSNSRFGSSMLMTSGLPNLICHSNNEYIQKAITLSKDPEKIKEYKVKLRKDNPLFDSRDYVKELERCFVKLKSSSQFKF